MNYFEEIEDLKNRLFEAEQLIEAIKAGEVDAFAIRKEDAAEVFTLQSGDYAYRILIEKFSEGALNVTEDGLIVYSNKYLYELLQISYENILGKSIYDFIHPDSILIYKALFIKGLTGTSKGEINLLAGDKTIPVYISLTSLYPKLPTVAIIITDLSQKYHNEKMLAAKNRELEEFNAELASFSYVASHDLKEPLRKIQTFSKRILEEESFSGKTADYFKRIIAASERMEHLIDSLLEFSRANILETTFEPCDLNEIIEEAQAFLHENILEKKAEIKYEKLLVMPAVKVQLVQLMTNLLDNALKYSKTEINPLITIAAELIEGNRIDSPLADDQKQYYRIEIADNGIGFEEQYSQRIFELFKRLHGRNEYSGTGIGLAICKKIVSNHNGFIIADSTPGIGSTFNIFIPNE